MPAEPLTLLEIIALFSVAFIIGSHVYVFNKSWDDSSWWWVVIRLFPPFLWVYGFTHFKEHPRASLSMYASVALACFIEFQMDNSPYRTFFSRLRAFGEWALESLS